MNEIKYFTASKDGKSLRLQTFPDDVQEAVFKVYQEAGYVISEVVLTPPVDGMGTE